MTDGGRQRTPKEAGSRRQRTEDRWLKCNSILHRSATVWPLLERGSILLPGTANCFVYEIEGVELPAALQMQEYRFPAYSSG